MFYLAMWVFMFVMVCCIAAGGTLLQSRLRRRCIGTSEGYPVIIEEESPGYHPGCLLYGPYTPSPPPYKLAPPHPTGYKAMVGGEVYESTALSSGAKTPPPNYSQIFSRGSVLETSLVV